MTVNIDIIGPMRARLGEGAVWDAQDARLWWVDIPLGRIFSYAPEDGSQQLYEFGEPVGCIARREAGGLIAATKTGFHLFDPDKGTRSQLVDPESHLAGNRFNDGGTDPAGRFWAGSMHDDGSPRLQQGRFYRYDAGDATAFFDPLYTSNGLAFSPAGDVMYVSDSNGAVQTIWAYDYDLQTGTPSNGRIFLDCRQIDGRPDGATVDSEGCYWFAAYEGGQVVRLTPEGEIDRRIAVPVTNPTKPMFGGPDLDILYVTSAGGDGTDKGESSALDGALLAITGIGVTGINQARQRDQ